MRNEISRFKITLDILKAAQKEVNFQRYFDFLLDKSLIAKKNECYMLTADGLKLLNKLEDIESIMP